MDTAGEPEVIEPIEAGIRRGRLRTLFTSARTLARVAWRDPDHLPERMMLAATDRLGEPSRIWAEAALARRPDDGPTRLAAELRRQSALVARIDGAVAGTPFFIALIPGYVGYLWQEAAMLLRTAALFGRDPTALRTTAELLALRGIHPTVDAAEASLTKVRATPLPDKPSERRPLKLWIASVRMVLVIGGFMGPPDPEEGASRSRLAAIGSLVVGGLLWGLTWVFPLTFMIAMAWGCEHDTRELGWRALLFYSEDASDTATAIKAAGARRDSGHDKRQLARSALLFLSIAVPIGFVAFADHIRNHTGVNWVGALGALVALSLVIAMSVFARSR
jgi:hypothetical protein